MIHFSAKMSISQGRLRSSASGLLFDTLARHDTLSKSMRGIPRTFILSPLVRMRALISGGVPFANKMRRLEATRLPVEVRT